MSLFHTKEWWRTECGDSQESFDGQSLLLVRELFGKEQLPADLICVASHRGYLRIYAPTSQWDDELHAPTAYKSTDLVVEVKLADAIVDLKAGKFVSGSQDTRLAILTPTRLAIYSATLTKGSTEHGDRCSLQMAYEHQLKCFPASLTIGPFGGARGRDFLCVQCLDGTLLFYEQEVFAFSRVLKDRLLPEPLVYVARNDVFVTLGPGWVLECYRYQNMAEVGKKGEAEDAKVKKGVVPDWSYNIGEPILGIQTVVLSSFEVGIVILGERTLFCLGDACTSIKTAKRLEYGALCFVAYVIEPDGKLMVIVIADTSTLMIYEGTTLKWSAKLPFAPVAVARAHFQNLEGAIVVLSEEGRLEVCYLGSEPSLFVAPPIHRRGYDYAAAEKELLDLRQLLKKSSSSDDQVSNAMLEAELSINATVSPELLPSPYVSLHTDVDKEEDKAAKQSSMCKIEIELTSYTTLRDVQVILQTSEPLVISKDYLSLTNLCEKYTMETTVYLGDDQILPIDSEVEIVATYENDSGELRVVDKTVQIPLKMLLRPSPPESTAAFSVTIKSAEPVLNFSQIFPEFIGEYSVRQAANSLGLQHALDPQSVVTIASGLMLNRYRVQANDANAMTLVLHQLIGRLKDKAPKLAENLSCTIAQQHLQLVQDKIDVHFDARLKMKAATKEIGLLTSQLRCIERRMLRGMKERNSRSLAATGLPTLLESTYRAIFALLDDLEAARAERERAFQSLRNSLRLLRLMLQLTVSEDKCELFESAFVFKPQLRDEVITCPRGARPRRRQSRHRRLYSSSTMGSTLYLIRIPIVLLGLAVFIGLPACGVATESIKGSRETCDVEGEDFTVDKIPNTKCFNCICKNGFVECLKQQCPSIEGCYMLLERKKDDCCQKCKGCVKNNIHHQSGTEWTDPADPCRIFTCNAGVVTESKLRCYTPCGSPVPPAAGQCCPTCAGCLVNGQKVTEERSVTTTEDPCVACRCNKGRLTCAKKACPVLHCPVSRIVHEPGECCPRCKGSGKYLMPPRGACILGTTFHKSGQQIYLDECTRCSCHNSAILCTKETCPVLECASEYQTKLPGRCCPQCPVIEESRAACVYAGRTYVARWRNLEARSLQVVRMQAGQGALCHVHVSASNRTLSAEFAYGTARRPVLSTMR
ncbi:protein PTHB1-like isoform X2 [Phymastichus coffea]|uniref:protein PTHB1-like isoform X2 n=1 Tax=Phymastichus coffea TaxID=108790 RepID=UPI00273CF30E|nr:protein PTHB1-like isoform X2 [Phymastichus coffea]